MGTCPSLIWNDSNVVATSRLVPATTAEVADSVRHAAAAGTSLLLRAGGTKDRLGRVSTADAVLDLSALRGIVTYEPEELILIARPATPLAQVEALLAESILPSSPPSGGRLRPWAGPSASAPPDPDGLLPALPGTLSWAWSLSMVGHE